METHTQNVQGSESQSQRQIQNRNQQKVSRVWMYASIIVGVILLLIILSDSFESVEFKWIALLGVIFVGYKLYETYEQKKKEPSIYKIESIVKEYIQKKGLNYDLSPGNIQTIPVGIETWGFELISENVTFITFKNVLIGKVVTTLYDLKQDNNKQALNRLLAQKGVTELIEV